MNAIPPVVFLFVLVSNASSTIAVRGALVPLDRPALRIVALAPNFIIEGLERICRGLAA